MAPAPAFEPSSSMLSVFSMCTALPLGERDINGAACFSGSGSCGALAATSSKPALIRRGASFLDVEDACVGLTGADRACFLIPEDSVFVPPAPAGATTSRENAPGVGPRLPLPSGTFTTAAAVAATSTSGASLSALTAAPTGCFLSGGLPGCDEFVHASVCFEKAAQALEAVTRQQQQQPAQAPDAAAAPACSPSTTSSGCGAGEPGAADAAAAAAAAGCMFRRVSSLAPSPAASSHHDQPHQHHQDGTCCSSSSSSPEAVEAPALLCGALAEAVAATAAGAPALDDLSPPQLLLLPQQLGASSAFDLQQQLPLLVAQYDQQQQQQSAEAHEAQPEQQLQQLQPTAPAAAPAAPAPRAFHHKTGGPCDHCGATESPQWRRGPPAKPMLCNACGTRYRRTNQLGPVGAHTPAGRAAAAAAAAGASVSSSGKRAGKAQGGAAAKRNRASY
ncbi:hypothetical protein HYH02_008861 [Chlamydomonas schloesseri]|uniref:GATA-type domain-containing protein n=1 Tax=Chlamydomonas schloesseri TaxID=2026947 RepID=A0A835WCV9_9CHLO|nr:hypothetical protein HYH02_008861 [Chlamydomonas schloesseri]|eukprot:KAG2444991.1 hypothetical protein HYH02_008861 [Chlamydomonas schloesseri]